MCPLCATGGRNTAAKPGGSPGRAAVANAEGIEKKFVLLLECVLFAQQVDGTLRRSLEEALAEQQLLMQKY
jgi:hypothetical protein